MNIIDLTLKCSSSRLCHGPQTLASRQRRNVSSYQAVNEPILSYEEGSDEKKRLLASLEKWSSKTEDVPIIVGDEEIRTGDVEYQVEVGFLT